MLLRNMCICTHAALTVQNKHNSQYFPLVSEIVCVWNIDICQREIVWDKQCGKKHSSIGQRNLSNQIDDGHFRIKTLKFVESSINFPLQIHHKNHLNINQSSSFIAHSCFKEKCCQNRNRNKALFRWIRKQFWTLWKNSNQNRMQYKQIACAPQKFIQQYERIISLKSYRGQSPTNIMHQSNGSVFTLTCTFAVIYRVSISYLFSMKNSRRHSSTQIVAL